MRNPLTYIMAVVLVLLLTGCHNPYAAAVPVLPPAPKVAPEAKVVIDTAQAIRVEAQDVQSVAEKGSTLAPALPQWSILIGDASNILALTAKLDESAHRLDDAQTKIDALEAACSKQSTDYSKALGKLHDEQQAADRAAKARWTTFALGGGLLLALSIGLIVFLGGSGAGKMGIAGAAVGGSMVGIGTVMTSTPLVAGLVGGGLLLVVGGVIGLAVYREVHADHGDAVPAAKFAKRMLDDKKPEGPREFVAWLRGTWGAFDQAMSSLA